MLTDDQGRWVAMLPGVPREMRGMFADALLPRLSANTGSTPSVVRSRTVRTTGIAESQLPARLGDAAAGIGSLALAYLPGQEGVDLRLTSRGLSADEADRLLADSAAILSERLGTVAYGEGQTDLAEVVLALCRVRGLTISIAESCTGGMLGARLTAIPGSSDVFRGGVVAYDNEVKNKLLGVPGESLKADGAVSESVAREMAAGARRSTGSAIGIAITGIAGPGGGTPEKPVGLVWIAADVEGETRAFGARMIGDRAEIRFRATQAALDIVRRTLLKRDLPDWPGGAVQPLPHPK
jgi:nicotinamide-nucleotide amidase